MGDPRTIGAIGMGATAGGGILSAFGSLFQGQSQKEMYDYQASIAQLNQQIDQRNAEFARQTGEQQSTQYGLQAAQKMGKITTAQASSGFDIRSGSDAQVRASQQNLSRLDQATIRSGAATQAYNYQLQGTVAGAQANLYEMAGQNAETAGMIGAGSSLLGTASSVSSEWLKGNQAGLWGSGSSGGSVGGTSWSPPIPGF